MKVLHVIPSVAAAYGGPAFAIREMERALSTRGVDVTTATTSSRSESTSDLAASSCATRVQFSTQTSLYRVSIGLAIWLQRNISSFDLVHVHALFSFPSVIAACLAASKGVPYVVRPLGVLAKYGMKNRRPGLKRLSAGLLERPLIKSAAAVHFTSLAEQLEAEEQGFLGRSVVIPLGVSDVDESAQDFDRRYSPNGLRLLFLSRLDPKKNVEGLLRGFSLVRSEYPDLRLSIAGAGNPAYEATLRSLARDLGVADSVNWCGHVEGLAKAQQFADATAFILPSFSENFGIAVVEALAKGIPCIVSTGVAVASDIERERAGVMTATDPLSIADGIRRMFNANGYGPMSIAARRLAAREFSSDVMGQRLLDLYACIKAEAVRRRDVPL